MIVNGTDIPEATLTDAMAALGTAPFGVRDLQIALEAEGVDAALSYDTAKRVLQRERKAGALVHDQTSGLWSASPVAASTPPPSNVARTLPLPPAAAGHAPALPKVPRLPLPDVMVMVLAYLACLMAVSALALINASFAWEVAETDAFRLAFVMGLMASDLMRPLLVARGLWEMERRRQLRGVVAILVAVSLAPVSILSSTAAISATLHLGAEEIEQDGVQSQARFALQSEYDRLKIRADQAWHEWQAECDRGGCGPMAAEREATAKALEAETRARLNALLATTTDTQASTFLSRTVKAFEDLGLFGDGVSLAIPLLLALTLEIAALFGPGLLLASRRRK